MCACVWEGKAYDQAKLEFDQGKLDHKCLKFKINRLRNG